MRERRQITELWQRGGASVLVTLVRTEGSSYRQPGARLLIASGEYAGTISGGCLEAEVVRKAAWKVREGAAVERYSTLFDDTADIPYGLGCGGTVDLLLEPVETPECQSLLSAIAASLRGETLRVVSFLPGDGRGLRRAVYAADGGVVFASAGVSQAKLDCARGLLPGREYEGRFVEELRAPQRLFVLGAGDDAKPLVSMAALLGWSVVVADGRSQLARAERFPEAERVLSATAELAIHSEDAVVLMTHSYEQDRELLVRVLPFGVRYLGLLGARHRSSLLVSEAAALLGWSVAACCERLYAPVGLDLGGDGPEAIALAVIAEAQAAVMGKLGVSRKLRAEDVAEQIAKGGTSRYLQVAVRLVTAAIVLAAGASTRLGSPKQVVVLGGETLLERAVRVVREAGCAPVVVVLGALASAILSACDLGDAQVVVNAGWEEGMAASIACGVAAVEGEVDGVIVMACDQPAVTAGHLRLLREGGVATASGYAGRRGVPAYFPAASFEELLELRGDVGARAMLKAARVVELQGGELDVDRVEDLARARELFGSE